MEPKLLAEKVAPQHLYVITFRGPAFGALAALKGNAAAKGGKGRDGTFDGIFISYF